MASIGICGFWPKPVDCINDVGSSTRVDFGCLTTKAREEAARGVRRSGDGGARLNEGRRWKSKLCWESDCTGCGEMAAVPRATRQVRN
jgi:hypothetical protein